MGDHEHPTIQSRPFHCTTIRLTLAIYTNDVNSGSEFLRLGTAFAQVPHKKLKCKNNPIILILRLNYKFICYQFCEQMSLYNKNRVVFQLNHA